MHPKVQISNMLNESSLYQRSLRSYVHYASHYECFECLVASTAILSLAAHGLENLDSCILQPFCKFKASAQTRPV
jgi:hypothetical protein